MISIIVAIDDNNAIGKNGDLLCHMSADLKYFKKKTTGKKVLMGSKTYESLPKRPLPNRENIVVTKHANKTFEGAIVVHSIEELREKVTADENAFVIGGGSIYREMLPYADRLYITHIHHSWDDADTFFPKIEKDIWRRVRKEDHQADEKNPYDYTFSIYTRKKRK